ncbi:MAG TPA: (2Fe-2S)-binding protein [Chthonomonadaceae bacterium]|nr:(2Fe-2S)-binding protein [Chthonomonadaceae bacterium]
MSEDKPVRACLCYPHTFAELKRLAQENGWRTVAEITAALRCGSGCGLCRPYLAKMLETGETAFAVILNHRGTETQRSHREKQENDPQIDAD